MKRYEEVAHYIVGQIDEGVFDLGERIPGVRKLSTQLGVSISTVLQAHRLLENQGRIEARPRSGYFVCASPWQTLKTPTISRPQARPRLVRGHALSLRLARESEDADRVNLGAAVPADSFLPSAAINRALAATARRRGAELAKYALPPGHLALREQIAARMRRAGCLLSAEDILITNGCQEALSLSLRTVAQAGDVIAVESPTFFGLLQVIEALGLKALEIPTDPQTGVSLPALELALAQWPIKACAFVPNFNNPLGSCMPPASKQALVALLGEHQVPLIEDDIYGDLSFSGPRPPACKSFDSEGQVLYCSSFSKTISPGLRIGWVAGGRHQEALTYLKYDLNLAAPTLNQIAIADYLAQGGYDRHLRGLRSTYAGLVERMIHAVGKYFPVGTRVTRPKGGMLIWVELPKAVDALDLHAQAHEQGISICPGSLFTAGTKYSHCIRLNCAVNWNERIEWALATLGRLAQAPR